MRAGPGTRRARAEASKRYAGRLKLAMLAGISSLTLLATPFAGQASLAADLQDQPTEVAAEEQLPVQGSFTWQVADANSPGVPVEGTSWQIERNDGFGLVVLSLTDCVAGSDAGCSGGNDTNPAAGALTVSSLDQGDYNLWQVNAGEGYELAQQPLPFTITENNPHVTAQSAVQNVPIPDPEEIAAPQQEEDDEPAIKDLPELHDEEDEGEDLADQSDLETRDDLQLLEEAELDAGDGDLDGEAQPEKQEFEIMPLAAGPDPGIATPNVYWTVVDEDSNLVGGATFNFERRGNQGTGGNWTTGNNQGASGFPDCVSGTCGDGTNQMDRAPDAGEFVVNRYRTGGNGTQYSLSNSRNYRVTPATAPSGYEWIDTAGRSINGNSDSATWGSQTYDFGSFKVRKLPASHTIVVKKGSYRTGTGAADVNSDNTVGVRFELRQGSATGAAVGICEIQASRPGECVFEGIPNTGNGTNRTYYPVEIAPALNSPAAATFTGLLTTFGTGSSGSNQAYQYSVQVGTGAYTTYTVPTSGGSGTTASSGFIANRAANPQLSKSCDAGVRVAVLVDTSGSVAGYQNDLAKAATALVDGLAGTPSSVAMLSFATISPGGITNHPVPQSVQTTAGANIVKSWYSTSSSGGATANFTPVGGTNWDDGLWKTTQGAASNDYDIVFVLTDGNPTYSGRNGNDYLSGPGNSTTFRELERAIFSANSLKSKGARVITVGIGASADINDNNLAAISGPTKFVANAGMGLNDFDYVKAGWAQLEQVLRDFAQGLKCEATVTVEKQAQPFGGSWAPAPGWDFELAQTGAASVTPGTTQSTDANGQITWTLKFQSPSDEASGSVTESERDGWQLDDLTCTGGAEPNLTDRQATFDQLGIGDNVKCTFKNRQEAPSATVKVAKQWVVNGETYPHGQQPDGLEAQLDLTPQGTPASSAPSWDETRGGFVVGGQVSIGEEATINNAGCTLDGSVLAGSGITGSVDISDSAHQVTLPGTANQYTITNTVSCQSLKLVKLVTNEHGGNLDSGDWDGGLFAKSGDTTLTFNSGEEKGVLAADYVLSETDHPGYELEDLSCTEGLDSETQTVTVAKGKDVVCTFTNRDLPGEVQWSKIAAGTGELLGGSVWTISGPGIAGGAVDITDCETGVCPTGAFTDQDPGVGQFKLVDLSWGQYTLQEKTAPPGYRASGNTYIFTVDANHLEGINLTLEGADVPNNEIENEQQVGPTLPLTGGLGRDQVYLAGGMLLLLGAAAYAVYRIRIRKAA